MIRTGFYVTAVLVEEIMNLYTRQEAASHLKIGLRTLDRRLASGELECYRLGDGPKAPVRIAEEQLLNYLLKAATDKRVLNARARDLLDTQNFKRELNNEHTATRRNVCQSKVQD